MNARAFAWVLLVGACTSSSTGNEAPRPGATAAPEAAVAPPAKVVAAAAVDAPAACPTAAADAAARSPGATAVDPVDVDGDGVGDPVFRESCGGMGNCDYLMYLEPGGCAQYLGNVTGAVYADPWCVDPGSAGKPCRISINRHMIHGDTQQYFFEYVGGAYQEAGAGKHFPHPPKQP
jgi:hypothetical protein